MWLFNKIIGISKGNSSGWLDEAIQNEHINVFEYDGFEDFQKIGSGGSGKVYKAIFKKSETFALKSYNYDTVDIKEVVNEVNCNINIFLVVNKKNI
jgi:hypothetical protein